MEYCHGGRPAGGRSEIVGGRDPVQIVDQSVLTGGRGWPIAVEKVIVNILLIFLYVFIPRLIW